MHSGAYLGKLFAKAHLARGFATPLAASSDIAEFKHYGNW
jgi:hypothetical protein